MEPNPYQSPLFPTESVAIPYAKVIVDFDLRKVRAQVRPPAISLMVVAAIAVGIDIGLLLSGLHSLGWSSLVDTWSGDGWMSVMYVVLAYGLMAFVHLVVFYGAYQLYRVHDDPNVGLALAISIMPLLSPGFILGIPIAIWAYVVLARADVHAALDA